MKQLQAPPYPPSHPNSVPTRIEADCAQGYADQYRMSGSSSEARPKYQEFRESMLGPLGDAPEAVLYAREAETLAKRAEAKKQEMPVTASTYLKQQRWQDARATASKYSKVADRITKAIPTSVAR